MKKQGTLFIVSAPSGAGKTSLCRGVLERMENLKFSISYTTRPPRHGEADGQDYFFVDEDYFEEEVRKDKFIEWAKVHGHYYGTSKKLLSDWTRKGIDVILDIDAQGAMRLQSSSQDRVFIYILPPSFDILRERLNSRGADSPEEIARRLKKAGEEIRFYNHYQYLLVNEVYETALDCLEAIILAERMRIRQTDKTWVEENFTSRM